MTAKRKPVAFEEVVHLVNDPVVQLVARQVGQHESLTFLSSYAPIPVTITPTLQPIKHLSRRRRIEAALIPAMCFEVVHYWSQTTPFDTERLKHDFTTAIEQMITGETEKRATKLAVSTVRTARKLFHAVEGGYFEDGVGWTYPKIAMVLYFLCCDLTAEGIFELEEGSVMHLALELFKAEAMKGLHPKQIESAEKQARQFREWLGEKPRELFKGN